MIGIAPREFQHIASGAGRCSCIAQVQNWGARSTLKRRRTGLSSTCRAGLALAARADLTRWANRAPARGSGHENPVRHVQTLRCHFGCLYLHVPIADSHGNRNRRSRDVTAVDVCEVVLPKPTPLLEGLASRVIRIWRSVG